MFAKTFRFFVGVVTLQKAQNVDNSSPTYIGLCTGYGGMELGIQRAIGRSLNVLAYAEIEAFAIENLVAKMEQGLLPQAPIWSDLRTFPSEDFSGMVDILEASYPCSPFSQAGKRKGKNDPRHLWPYIRSIVGSIRPVYVFFENVEGHVTLGLSSVLSDLGELGYKTTWGIFSASEVGAPQQRKRVFILAKSASDSGNLRSGLASVGRTGKTKQAGLGGELCWTAGSSELGYAGDREPCGIPEPKGREKDTPIGRSGKQYWPSRPNEPQYDWEPPRVVDVTKSGAVRTIGKHGRQKKREGDKFAGTNSSRDEAKGIVEPPLGRDAYEYPDRLVRSTGRIDELRLLGNGVVPAQAARAWETLIERMHPDAVK